MRTLARRVALAVAVGLASPVAVAPLERAACAQTDAELAAARKLFAEALKDEQAKRYDDALDKFRRVQQFRDTQAVRYRVAACLEALGKLRDARAAYGSAAMASSGDAQGAEIARASREKMDALGKRVARLVVVLGANAPPDAVVKVDGEPVQSNAIGTPIVVDPGAHEIVAGGTNAAPFRAQVTIPEGGQATINVPLEQTSPPPVAPPPVATAPAPAQGTPAENPPTQGRPRDDGGMNVHSSGARATGIVLTAAGGVLLAGGLTFLLVRHAEIAAITRACPGGVCPRAREDDLRATRDRALAEGPIAVGFGVAGVAAAGIGVYLLVTSGDDGAPSPSSTSSLAPWVGPSAGGVTWRGAF